MTCCRSEGQQHNTISGEHQQHNSSKSGEQQQSSRSGGQQHNSSSRSGGQQHNSSSRSGEQQHPGNSIAEERQHLNSSRVEDHRLHHHHINRKSIRFTRDVEPEEDRNESAAGIRIHIQVRRDCRDPAGVISVLWIRVRIRRFRMFCGPPGSGYGSLSQRYGSGSGSFHHQAKIVRKP
jgi:hypothetical protein